MLVSSSSFPLNVQRKCVCFAYIRSLGGQCIATARVFRGGNSQAVRLPKKFRLKSKEVEICARGDEIVLREKPGTMVRAFGSLAGLPDDIKLRGRQKVNRKAQGGSDEPRFLLDTKICIYIREKRPEVLRRFPKLRAERRRFR